MTTCAECLTAVSTMRLADILPGSPLALHCEACPDCASLVRETAYAERRLSDTLREMRPGLSADSLSASALEGSERLRRKEVGRWVRGLLSAAACITVYFFVENVIIPRVDPPQRIVRETILLKCITPEQAAEVATPYLRSHGSAIYRTGGLHAITLSGQAPEFTDAVNHVKVLDDEARCTLPLVAPTPAPTPAPAPDATSSDKPGKD